MFAPNRILVLSSWLELSATVSCMHCTEYLSKLFEGQLIYDVRRQEYAAANQAVMVRVSVMVSCVH